MARTKPIVGSSTRARSRWSSPTSAARSTDGADRHSTAGEIAVSDRTTLEGLTQFACSSRHACQQMIGTTGHAESDMREGKFCAILFRTARKCLILNGEMSEWLKEHAWKACVGETLPRVRIPLSPPIP